MQVKKILQFCLFQVSTDNRQMVFLYRRRKFVLASSSTQTSGWIKKLRRRRLEAPSIRWISRTASQLQNQQQWLLVHDRYISLPPTLADQHYATLIALGIGRSHRQALANARCAFGENDVCRVRRTFTTSLGKWRSQVAKGRVACAWTFLGGSGGWPPGSSNSPVRPPEREREASWLTCAVCAVCRVPAADC
jgi:hypothetical protein